MNGVKVMAAGAEDKTILDFDLPKPENLYEALTLVGLKKWQVHKRGCANAYKWVRVADLPQLRGLPKDLEVDWGALGAREMPDDLPGFCCVDVYSKHGKFPRLRAGDYITDLCGHLLIINFEPRYSSPDPRPGVAFWLKIHVPYNRRVLPADGGGVS
jgi:hypothetical protein